MLNWVLMVMEAVVNLKSKAAVGKLEGYIYLGRQNKGSELWLPSNI